MLSPPKQHGIDPQGVGGSITGLSEDVTDRTRRDSGLSHPDLWIRYFALGGMSTPAEVETYLRYGVAPSSHDHDILAQALNERFSELGRNHPVHYAGAAL